MILILTLLPAAVGCAAYPYGLNPDDSNPPFSKGEHCYNSDGLIDKEIPSVARIILDCDGHIAPDPATGAISSADFRSCAYCIKKCVELYGEYDAGRVSKDIARKINALCADDRTLIVLIAGFNSTYPEHRRSFKLARMQVQSQFPGRRFAFLEVYWQGLYGSPLAIWPEAMCNSKWAGLGLRNLLGRLDPAIRVRVLTHSRGASVICAALWNTPLRSTVEADARYLAAEKAVPPPVLPRIRIGLLAPAMRVVDFEAYFDRGASEFCFHDRIVLGINPDDEALNAGGLSGLVGTALGCSPKQFDDYLAPLLNKGHIRAFAVDFSGSVVHAFQDYLLRDVFEASFLSKLLGEDAEPIVATVVR